MAIASINPATGETLKEFPAFDDNEIEKRLDRAEKAFARHRRETFPKRAQLLVAAASLLEQEKERFARIMTLEMGKLFRAAIEEIEKCARGCRYYAENAERFLEDEPAQTDAARSYVHYEPLGPVLAVMPWNFPFWQVFRFAAPALMAGNVGLLKHAANVPQCALEIEEIFCRAGFDEGVFQTLLIESSKVEKVIVDPRIRAVTLTGSEKAGSAVASAAAREIKKAVLELGGSDAFIVMPSADFGQALNTAVKARTINTGQSCIAAKRFFIADQVYNDFLRQFVERMRALKVGDPFDEATEIGPLASEQILNGVHEQVQKSIAAGAKLLTGGNRIHGPGFFYEPTVLVDVPKKFACLSRGNLRPGGVDFSSTRFGRGDRAGQRQRIRIGSERVDKRPGRTGALRLRTGKRNGLHQRHGCVRPAIALRRSKTFRFRARTWCRRHSRVRQHEDSLDRLTNADGLRQPSKKRPEQTRLLESRSIEKLSGRGYRPDSASRLLACAYSPG